MRDRQLQLATHFLAAALRVASVAVIASVLAGCTRADSNADLARRVDALLAPLVNANEFSGAVVLARGGKIIYQRGFGMANHAAGLPFTPDTAADGGSLAKTFTAAGLWWLVHEGKVDPDAPVVGYVEEFPHAQTTVRQLLSHSNGLPPDYEFFDPFFAAGEVKTTTALLRIVGREQPAPEFPSGSRFEYSNLGYDAGALVIERATGRDYEAFLRERFFSRLGMHSTYARPPRFADWNGVRTMGYRWSGAAWEIVDVFDGEAFLGASNLYFPATDLARWGIANAAGAAVPAEVNALGGQRSLIDAMPSPITGLSWYCDETSIRCYYTGSINAFHSFVYWDRSRNETAVFVSNSSLPPWPTITLQRALVAAMTGDARADTPASFESFTRETRSAVAGTYSADGLGNLTVSAGSKGLRIQLDAGLEFDAFQVSPEVFYVPGPDYWLAFSNGQSPVKAHVRSMFIDVTARRVP